MAKTKTPGRVTFGSQSERALFEVYLGDESCWDTGNDKTAKKRLMKQGWVEGDPEDEEPVYEITEDGKEALGLPSYKRQPSFTKALKDVVIAMFGPEPEPSSDPLSFKIKVRTGEAEEGTVLAMIDGAATTDGTARQDHWQHELRWRAIGKFLSELGYPCHVTEHGEVFDEDDSAQSYAEIPGRMDVVAGEM